MMMMIDDAADCSICTCWLREESWLAGWLVVVVVVEYSQRRTTPDFEQQPESSTAGKSGAGPRVDLSRSTGTHHHTRLLPSPWTSPALGSALVQRPSAPGAPTRIARAHDRACGMAPVLFSIALRA